MAYITDKNGKYKRTVHCGYCYEAGHNKGSCKAKKQNHKDQIAGYEQQIAEDNFCDDWERRHAKSCLERHKAALDKSVNRGQNRKCSYCSTPGHTRRTCKRRKGDMNSYATHMLAAREKFAENFQTAGLGVGTLLSVKTWHSNKVLALVQKIQWEDITHEMAFNGNAEFSDIIISRAVTVTPDYPSGECFRSKMHPEISNINSVSDHIVESRRTGYQIVSPIEEIAIPDNFLTLEGCLVRAAALGRFEKERHYDYYNVDYDD